MLQEFDIADRFIHCIIGMCYTHCKLWKIWRESSTNVTTRKKGVKDIIVERVKERGRPRILKGRNIK